MPGELVPVVVRVQVGELAQGQCRRFDDQVVDADLLGVVGHVGVELLAQLVAVHGRVMEQAEHGKLQNLGPLGHSEQVPTVVGARSSTHTSIRCIRTIHQSDRIIQLRPASSVRHA